jgi:hypothetical protein
MPTVKVKSTARVTSWWLSGDEDCPHCGQLYAYEIEFRCPECDTPGCPHCRHVHLQGHIVCPGCVAATEEHGNG